MDGGIMDVLATELKYHTVEDIYALPDGQRSELVDGQIYSMAPPSTKHQRLLNYINTEINLYIRKNNRKCEVFPAPFAVFLNDDNTNYVEPDISVICNKEKITDKGCYGAPDWVIEVVSLSSKRMDYYIKLFKYRTTGVREYWIVDSIKQRVMVYNFEYDTIEEYTLADKVKAGIYENFEIDFSQTNIG